MVVIHFHPWVPANAAMTEISMKSRTHNMNGSFPASLYLNLPTRLLASLFRWDSVRLDNLRLASWQTLPCRLSSDTLFFEQVGRATVQWLNTEWSTLCQADKQGPNPESFPWLNPPLLMKSRITEYFSERTNLAITTTVIGREGEGKQSP